jgi:glycerol-3-phosphate dehydrogenase (NAD(P)+)
VGIPAIHRAAVMGAGSWGTTFAKVLADAGCSVVLWARREEVAASIRDEHTNPDYLPGIRLPDAVTATGDADEALSGADLIAIAVPAQTLRGNMSAWTAGGAIGADATLVSLMKGIELGTGKRMSEVIVEVAGVEPGRVVALTGPNLAGEIASGHPTAAVVACIDDERAAIVQDAIATPYLRPYTNVDVIGCELGGAVKNVIALACGMAAGMGLGDNTKATLITRGLAETARLGMALGADPMTFSGRCRATGRSASTWVGVTRWRRPASPPGRPPRASRAAARSATWPARKGSRCRSPSRWSWSVTRAYRPRWRWRH